MRIGDGRLTLDLLVEQYENGMTPEDMVRAYDTLALADAYAAIAYYLRHRDEVHASMGGRAGGGRKLEGDYRGGTTSPFAGRASRSRKRQG